VATKIGKLEKAAGSIRQRQHKGRAEALPTVAGTDLPPPARKTIDLEGRVVKDGVRKCLKDHQTALTNLIHAIREYRKLVDQPLTLRGSDYAHAVEELNKAIHWAEGLLQ
jgi:hypothetical protein